MLHNYPKNFQMWMLHTRGFYKTTPSQKVGVGSLEKEIQFDDNHKIPGTNMRKWCVSLLKSNH